MSDCRSPSLWRFGTAEFDEVRWELRIEGRLLEIEPRPLEILRLLLSKAGEVVAKGEMLDAVYGHRHVSDGTLSNAIAKLRKALDDDDQSIIATVHKVGYRLMASARRSPVPGLSQHPVQFKAGDAVPRREDWKLTRPLMTGRDAEVWLAGQAKTGAQRVFKFSATGSRLSTFKREVALFRVLDQRLGRRPNWVAVLGSSLDQAPFFIESEYGGLSLPEWASSRGGLATIQMDDRLRLMAEIAESVALAHSVGVLHKDLKPANTLIDQRADGGWYPRLTDFGSGRLLEPGGLAALCITGLDITQTQAISGDSFSGTALYLAPELMAGESPTEQSDVYALGVMLYQLTAGDFRRPLAAGWEVEVPDELLREDIASAANGSPSRRFQSARELAERLRSLPERRLRHEQKRRDAAVAVEQKVVSERVRRRRLWMLGAAASLAVTISLGLTLGQKAGSRDRAPVHAALALIPLKNDSPDSGSDFFADGLSDELTSNLARQKGLRVISRAAAAKFKGEAANVGAIGQKLGVTSVLLGSVRRDGERLHLAMELVDAANGRAIWSQTFDRSTGDIFAVQAEITHSVASALGLEDNRTPLASTRSVGAHDAYLRGLAHFHVPTIESRREAVKDFDEAIRLDRNFARAYAELGAAWGSIAEQVGGDELRDALERSRGAAQKAIALDPNLSAPHAMVGWLLTTFDWQPSAAEAELKRAIELAPSELRPITGLAALYANLGRLEEAVRLMYEAVEVHPLSAIAQGNLAGYLIPLGRFEEAERSAWKAINLQPSGAANYALLTIIDIERGDKAAALRHAAEETDEIWKAYAQALATAAGNDKLAADQALQELTQKYGNDAPSQIADVHALRGEPDQAFEWLDKAYELHDPGAYSVLYTPFLLRYRSDPRFVAYCQKLGLGASGGKV